MSDGWTDVTSAEDDGWSDVTDQAKPRTSFTEDLKIGAADALNVADKWGTSVIRQPLANLLGGPEDKEFDDLKWRVQGRKDWANPENKEQGFWGKAASVIPQIPAYPFSPADTGQQMLDNGETLSRSVGGALADTTGNVAGLAIPAAVGARPLARIASGAASNAAQDTAVRKAIQEIGQTEATKEQFAPTWETAGLAALMGGPLAALPSGRAKPKPKVNIRDMEAELNAQKAAEVVRDPEQMELPLETSVQQIAEQRGDALGQPDLFGPTNTARADAVGQVTPETTKAPIADEQQGLLPFDTTPEQIAANRAGDRQIDMFVGNEIRTPEQQASVLSEPVAPTPTLDVPSKASDVAVRETADGFEAIKDGKVVGYLKDNLPRGVAEQIKENANVDIVKVDPEVKGTGVGKALYEAFNEKHGGRIAPSGKTSPDAWKLWKRNYPEKVDKFVQDEADRIRFQGADSELVLGNISDPTVRARVASETAVPGKPYVPHSQRGGLLFTHKSPEVIQAKKDLEASRKRSAVSKILGTSEPYGVDINTPEKVLAASEGIDDISALQLARFKTVTPGVRKASIQTNNPLLKFLRDQASGVFKKAEALTRKAITGKEGLGSLYESLSPQELVDVSEAVKMGDRTTTFLTDDHMNRLGFNDKQKAFVKKYYETDALKLKVWNASLAEVGMPPVKERPGHFPGIFGGDYKSLVMDKDGHVVGYIGTDTKYSYNKAVKEIQAKFPGSTITPVQRSKMGGSGNRSDIFSGLNDLISLLGRDDPHMKEVQAFVNEVIKQNANGMFGQSNFALDKKGIFGNEGNKPWQKDAADASREMWKAYFRHFEEGMISHLNLPVEAQLRNLLDNPELNMPRAKEYVNKYIQSMTGRSVGDFGMALNTLMDAPSKLVGLGPSITREAAQQFNKRMGQLTMGFGNIPFLAIQLLQPAQTVVPEVTKLSKNLGLSATQLSGATAKAFADAAVLAKRAIDPDYKPKDAFTAEMVQFAEEHGMLNFSEFEDANLITQNKWARRADKAIDWNRQFGEKATRGPVFFQFARMLEQSGLSHDQVLGTAFNLTQDTMIDYSAAERPMMFKNLGVAGQLAGGLQTYAFNFLSQYSRWAKDAATGKDIRPFLAGNLALIAFAGLTGVPAYQEMDELVQMITNKFFDKPQSIADLTMKNLPEWLKTGALSHALDLNMQSRLSAADALPDSPIEAISPYASKVGQMAGAGYDVAKHNDPLAWKNAAVAFSPTSLKGILENYLQTDEEGYKLNARGERDFYRPPEAQKARAFATTTMTEAQAREGLWKDRKKSLSDMDKRKEIAESIRRGFVQGGPAYLQSDEHRRNVADYLMRKGTLEQLTQLIVKAKLDAQMTGKQRAEGIPTNSLGSIYKYQYYNEEN